MQNPGSIRTGKSQMLHGGISDPRNKAMMKMLNLLRIGEHAGSGVPDIYAAWEDKGWQPPLIEEQYNPDRTILTLPMEDARGKTTKKTTQKTTKKTTQKTTQKTGDIMLKLMKDNPSITMKELSDAIGVTTDGVKYHIRKKKDEGILEREGGDKGGKWIVHI